MAETLISPGVLARENDQSQITSQPIQAGAAIVGPTVLGRKGIPKLVTSYSEYLANFGSTFTSGSDTYTYFTSISAYNYFNNGGTSLLVDRVNSGSFSPASSSLVSGTAESGVLESNFNMTGSATGGSGGSAGNTSTNKAADSQTGDGTGATFDYVVAQTLGKLVTEDIFDEITTNTTIAGAATYQDVATTSDTSGTGLKLDVVVAGTTAPTISSATVDASNKGSGYVAGEIITIAAGALGTGQLITADDVLAISGGAGKTAMGAVTGPFTLSQVGAVTGGDKQTGAGMSVALTNGGGSGALTAATIVNIGTNYVTGNVITFTQAELIAAGFTATVGDIILTLTSAELQDSGACTFTLVGTNIQWEPTTITVGNAAGSGYAIGDALTFTDTGTAQTDIVLTLTAADLVNTNVFTLETISEGIVMNNTGTESTNGALISGSRNNVRWEIQAPNTGTGTFSVIIRQGDDNEKRKSILEIFPNVSLDPKQSNYVGRIIGDKTEKLRGSGTDLYVQTTGSYGNGSRYVRVSSVNLKTPDYFDNSGIAKPEFAGSIPSAQSGTMGGADGIVVTDNQNYYDDINNNDSQGIDAAAMDGYTDAFNLLANKDDYKYNILTAPGLTYANAAAATPINLAIQNVQGRGDAICIIDLENYGSTVTATTATAASIDNSYAAAYWPWLQLSDPDSRQLVWVPASTLMPGVYAYNDKSAEAWFAPAGINRGGLNTVTQAERKLTQTNRDDLYTGKVNPIATFPGRGVVVFGQKTLQAQASALDRVNVRRLLIELKSYISQIADNLVFEQNTAATRNGFLAQVNPYLSSVQQRQGLYAFKVVMDASNNGPEVVDRNQMVGAIYLQPTKTAEFIYLDFNILPTGASFPS